MIGWIASLCLAVFAYKNDLFARAGDAGAICLYSTEANRNCDFRLMVFVGKDVAIDQMRVQIDDTLSAQDVSSLLVVKMVHVACNVRCNGDDSAALGLRHGLPIKMWGIFSKGIIPKIKDRFSRNESPPAVVPQYKTRELGKGGARVEIEVTTGPLSGEKTLIVVSSPSLAYFNQK